MCTQLATAKPGINPVAILTGRFTNNVELPEIDFFLSAIRRNLCSIVNSLSSLLINNKSQ